MNYNKSEKTKVDIHYHLGNEVDDKTKKQVQTADRTLANYKTFEKKFSIENARSDIQSAIDSGYGIFAATNSNIIYAEEIEILRNEYSAEINIIPGVEINLKSLERSKDKYLHVVILFDPSNYEKIYEKSKSLDILIQENEKPFLELHQFIDLVSDRDLKCIIAAHGIKQPKRSSENNSETLTELIGLDDVIPILIEDGKEFHKEQLKIRLQKTLSLSKKDLKWLDLATSISSLDRLNVGVLDNPDYIWGGNSFEDLFFASLMGGHRIIKESDIVPRKNYIKSIQFKNTDHTHIATGKLNFSYGLNTIVGPSGSGKTLLLEIIYSKLMGKSLSNKTISSNANYKEIFRDEDIILLDENNVEINTTSNYKVYEGKNLYNEIIQAYSSDNKQLLEKFNLSVNNSNLEDCIESYFEEINKQIQAKKTIKKKRNDTKIKLSSMYSSLEYLNTSEDNDEMLHLAEIVELGSTTETLEENLKKIEEDLTTLSKSFDNIKNISIRYDLKQDIINSMDELRVAIVEQVKINRLRKLIELQKKKRRKKVEEKIMSAVKSYNTSLGKRVEEYGKQFETFSNSISSILKNLKDIVRNERVSFTPIINKAKLLDSVKIETHEYFRLDKKINTKVNVSEEELFKMLESSIGTKPKINKSVFTKTFENNKLDFSNKDDIDKLISLYATHNENLTLQYSKNSYVFVDYDIEIKTMEEGFQSIDKVTAGNLAKIYISYMFEKEIEKEGANVLVVYDQPEANMEKKFIHDILSDKIKELRLTSQVIVATHEPLLVVNADANQIILSNNDKLLSNQNNISYENISFVGTKSKSEMIENLANLIDGAPAAISKRNKIYGGLINNE